MKNHWIKRKEDKEKVVVFKGTFQEAGPNTNKRTYLMWDQIVKEMMEEEDKKFLHAVNEAINGTLKDKAGYYK